MKAFFAIVIGVIGLLITTCGLVFIGSQPPIAAPFVLLGGLLLWGAVALYQSWKKAKMAATPAQQPHDAAPPPP
jgi:hypothetical protein